MDNKKQLDTEMIHGMIWWAETRIAGNYGDGEECTEDELHVLNQGMKKIEEHYQKINDEIEKMLDNCPLHRRDYEYAKHCLATAERNSEYLEKLYSTGSTELRKIIRQNQAEEKDAQHISEPLVKCNIKQYVIGMASKDKNAISENYFDLHDTVFRSCSFQLAVFLGDDVAKAYLHELAGQLFEDCDPHTFADVLMKMYRRRQKKYVEVSDTTPADTSP